MTITFDESADRGDATVQQMEEATTNTTPTLFERKASVSEATELAGGTCDAPKWLSWFEIPFHVADPKTGTKLPEACGWGMDSAGRGPLNAVGSYIGQAIVWLASRDAGCPSPRNCDGTVAGLKPSSLLTLKSSVVGVLAAILMPVFGAIVDHTPHRRMVGVLSGVLVVSLTGMQIGINMDNWVYILIVDALQGFALLVHVTAVFAYLPDLSLDQDVIAHYTSHFNIRQYAAQIVFVGLLIAAGQVRDIAKPLDASVQTARDGAGIAFGFGFLFIGYAWTFLFRHRPALSKVPEGSTLLTTGFKRVNKTARKIWKDYRALKWFMISLLWSPEAGAGVVQSIVVTFLTVTIRMTGLEIAKASLILMGGNVVGSAFAKLACRWFNPLNSYRLALLLLAAFVALSLGFLDSPERLNAVYGFATTWGFAMGMCYPCQRVLFCTLIPKGQETEMMGLFVFTGQILGWLPPLLFTIMNEKGVDIRWGVSLIPFFCTFAAICTLPMGSYAEATDLVAKDSEAKLNSVIEAASKHQPTAEFSVARDVPSDTPPLDHSEEARAPADEED